MWYTLFSIFMDNISINLVIYTTVLGSARWAWQGEIVEYELTIDMTMKKSLILY